MVLFVRIYVLRGFPASAYREYASPKTLVRPWSEQKLLIYELETHRAYFAIVDGRELIIGWLIHLKQDFFLIIFNTIGINIRRK